MPYPLGVNENGIIEPRPIDPTETFVNADDSGLSENSILDYWVWAFSDLVSNTERGVLAEYLRHGNRGQESCAQLLGRLRFRRAGWYED